MLEKDAIKIVRLAMERVGFTWVRKNHGDMFSVGRTDLEALSSSGKLIALEMKRGLPELNHGVTALQWAEIRSINSANGYAAAMAITPLEARGTWKAHCKPAKDKQILEAELHTYLNELYKL